MGYHEYRPVGIVFIAIALLFGIVNRIIWFPLPKFWWRNPYLFLVIVQVCVGTFLMIAEVDSADNLQLIKMLYYVGLVLTLYEISGFFIPQIAVPI